MKVSVRQAIVVLVVFLCVAGCERAERTSLPPRGPDETPGVTSKEILIGSSLALSGQVAFHGKTYRQGAMAYINEVNARGGVHGRSIRLISYDDAYDPSRSVFNTQKLIVDDNVFALFNYLGTPTGKKIVPIAERYKVPLVGMMTGASLLREPLNRQVFHVRASYADEIDSALRHLKDDLQIRDVALFYQNDSFGFDGLQLVHRAANRYGLRVVALGAYRLGAEDIGPALTNIRNSAAQAVVMLGLFRPCAKFITYAQKEGINTIFYAVSFVGPESLSEELVRLGYQSRPGSKIVVSQVVPPPDNLHLSAPREYSALMAKYFPGEPLTFSGLEGFLNAKILVEGLRRTGKRMTRRSFISGLESIWDYEIGIGQPIGYGAEDHTGLSHVYFNKYDNGRWIFFTNWQALAEQP